MINSSKLLEKEYLIAVDISTIICLRLMNEFALFQPDAQLGHWFDLDANGKQYRLTALAFMIAMTE